MTSLIVSTLTILGAWVLYTPSSHADTPPIRVAVLDSGLDPTKQYKGIKYCPDGHMDFTGKGLKPDNSHLGRHGENVSRLITSEAGNANFCIVMLKIFDNRLDDNTFAMMFAWRYSLDKGFKVINFSGGGIGSTPLEELILNQLADSGTMIFFAAGNKKINLDINCNFYPACYKTKGSVIVGNGDSYEHRSSTSNYSHTLLWLNGEVKGRPAMSGTSQATARATGQYIKKMYGSK